MVTHEYVYVWGGAGVYKIGRAKNPIQRVKAFPLMPYACGFAHILPTFNSRELEKALHRHFTERHINGEWFQLSSRDLEQIPHVAGDGGARRNELANTAWLHLIKREPRLNTLLLEVMEVLPQAEWFCANGVWYDVFKPKLLGLVGWSSTSLDPHIKSSQAYDIAYRTIYNALPDCHNCNCL